MNSVRALHGITSGRMRVYGELTRSFETRSGTRQQCSISPFLFNFVINELMEDASGDLRDVSAELANGEKPRDLDYPDDLVCLYECTEHVQHTVDRHARAEAPFGTWLASSKWKVLTQDWMSIIPNLKLDEEQLTTVNRFSYSRSFVMKDGNTVE